MPSRKGDVYGPVYLRQVFESLDVGVLVTDDEATYVDANRAACRLFAREPSEVVGRNIREFTAPEWLQQFGEIWEGFLREGEYHGIYPILLPDGSYRELSFNARANCAPGRHFTFVNEPPSREPSLSDEPYLTLCAWTKRVRLGEEWVPIEEYLRHTSGLQVSHGISPDAIAELAQEA